ncbi:hypothetical protein [Candidatus Bealeia paramacronuclearis]|uniref:hypothetical protein n=1 Tax=Candidatus Bealeia paramacronuclearis TaxID=1921001 RepID=UPI0030CDC648
MGVAMEISFAKAQFGGALSLSFFALTLSHFYLNSDIPIPPNYINFIELQRLFWLSPAFIRPFHWREVYSMKKFTCKTNLKNIRMQKLLLFLYRLFNEKKSLHDNSAVSAHFPERLTSQSNGRSKLKGS